MRIFVVAAILLATMGCRPPADSAQTVRETPWHEQAAFVKLPKRFVLSVTVHGAIEAPQALRLRFAGDTGWLSLTLDPVSKALQVEHRAAEDVTIGQAEWPESLAPGPQLLHVVVEDDMLSVYQDWRRMLACPIPLERWSQALWEWRSEAAPRAEFAIQKNGPVFLEDDFMHGDGELGAWQAGQGEWQVSTLKNPIRSANAYSLKPAKAPASLLAGHWFWRNYEFSTAVSLDQQASFSLLACYLDEVRFCELRYDPQGGELRLTQHHPEGAESWSQRLTLPTGQWSRLTLRSFRGMYSVWLDGERLLHAYSERPLLGGRLGVIAESSKVAFDDVLVRSVDELALDAELDAPLLHKGALRGLVLRNVSAGSDGSGIRARVRGPQSYVQLLQQGRQVELSEQLHGNKRSEQFELESPGRYLQLQVIDGCALAIVDGQLVGVLRELRNTQPGWVEAIAGDQRLDTLVVAAHREMPSVDNRVKTFTREETMAEFAKPGSEWQRGPYREQTVYLHRADFWQDVSARLDLSKSAADGPVGLALGGGGLPSYDSLATITYLPDETQLHLRTSQFEETLPLQAAPKSLRLERRSGAVLFWRDQELLSTQPIEARGLLRVGRFGGNPAAEKWPEAVEVGAEGVRMYAFKRAPSDWLAAAGNWEMTNRWQCDPRWSFFAGYQLDGVACNWNKLPHGDNVTLDFFVGPKMQQERGRSYEYAGDMNAVIGADGKDIASGYSFMFGGWNNAGSQIVRGKEVLLRNPQVKVRRDKSTHRRWFHIKIRKEGKEIGYWVDGKKVGGITDPEPLTGQHFGLWTWDNAMMVAQLQVSTSDAPAVQAMIGEPRKPRTPYDD
jgi:hypothetical protein